MVRPRSQLRTGHRPEGLSRGATPPRGRPVKADDRDEKNRQLESVWHSDRVLGFHRTTHRASCGSGYWIWELGFENLPD